MILKNYNIKVDLEMDDAVKKVLLVENVNRSVFVRSCVMEWIARNYGGLLTGANNG